MLGLATVLTDQGMEGIAAFVLPAPVRPKAAQPVEAAAEDEGSEVSLGTWILAGVAVVVVLGLGLGFWLAAQPDPAPPRSARVVTQPIQDLSGAASAAEPAASEPVAAETVEVEEKAEAPPEPAPREAASSAARPREPAQRRASRRPTRPESESVFVPNPEWTSQVRRMGEVDAETERSTMVILDSIHTAQERERERQPKVPASKGAKRE